MLNAYLTDVQNLLNDPFGNFYSPTNLTLWINKARRQLARDSKCIRLLPPSSGSVASITPTAGGSGYTLATVTISPPDAYGLNWTRATATAIIVAGAVTGYVLTNPGTGYINPIVTITGDGNGATATAPTTVFLRTIVGQEVYQFSTGNALLAANNPGVESIMAIQDVSVSWGSMKPTMSYLPWSAFQAYLRSWNTTTQNYPTIWSQFGQGATGNMYVWPIPSTSAQMEWDCYCTPIPLVDDTTPEAIPFPWTETVPFLACYFAYLNAQRRDDAALMTAEYKRFLIENRVSTTVDRVNDYYGAA